MPTSSPHAATDAARSCECNRCLIAETRKSEVIRTLAGGFHHHLNNELQTIYGHGNFLAGSALTPAIALSTQAVLASARRLAELSARFAACMRAGSARAETVDLCERLGSWSSDIANLCGQDTVLTITPPDGPILVNAPGPLLRGTLLQLVSNAVDALQGVQHKVIHVHCGVCELSGPVMEHARPLRNMASAPYGYVEIQDNGEGISPANLPRVFDPFFSTRLLGRGLGLFEVLNTVDGCGGLVSIRSSGPGSGTHAQLLFRCAPQQDDQRPPSGSGAFAAVERSEQ